MEEFEEELPFGFIDSTTREPHQCQHEGCQSQEGIECRVWGEDTSLDDHVYYYCAEHTHKNGFCYGCGQFWAGVSNFDFGSGLCENCLDNDDNLMGQEDEDFDFSDDDAGGYGMDEEFDRDGIEED